MAKKWKFSRLLENEADDKLCRETTVTERERCGKAKSVRPLPSPRLSSFRLRMRILKQLYEKVHLRLKYKGLSILQALSH